MILAWVSLKLKKGYIVCETKSIMTIMINLILVQEFFMEKLNLQSIMWNNYLK
jgi:hypothetical protein